MHPSSEIHTELVRQREAELRRLACEHSAEARRSVLMERCAAVADGCRASAVQRLLARLAGAPYR